MSTDPGDLLAGEPLCVMCEINAEHIAAELDKPFPHHEHLDGRTPLIGCRPCFDGDHEGCDPHGYFCSCPSEKCRRPLT